jgi:hypothetical protein
MTPARMLKDIQTAGAGWKPALHKELSFCWIISYHQQIFAPEKLLKRMTA